MMPLIVFVNITEICYIVTFVVLTVTCRDEFQSIPQYLFVWLAILTYFVFYVYMGYKFVIQFKKLILDCERYLKPYNNDLKSGVTHPQTLLTNYDTKKLEECFKESLSSEVYLLNWIPAVTMLIMAEIANEWKGSRYFYMPCLVVSGLTICYKTFKL